MPIIGATEIQPVNVLGSYIQGMEMGRANQLAQQQAAATQRQQARAEEQYQMQLSDRERERQRQALEEKREGYMLLGQIAGTAVDQSTYDQAYSTLESLGVDMKDVPRIYDPKLVKTFRDRTMTEAQRLDLEIRKGTLDIQRTQAGTAATQARTAAAQERRLSQAAMAPTGEQFKVMTPKEISDAGFPAGTVAQKDTKTGKVQVLSAVPATQRPPAPKTSDPAVTRVEAAAKQLTSQLQNVKTGTVSGVLSRMFDASDAKLFETYREQLSGAVRAALRIPGEGTLSDQEQAQYGLQLPSLGQTKENNEKIVKALINQVRLAKQLPVKEETATPSENVDFVYKDGRFVPVR